MSAPRKQIMDPPIRSSDASPAPTDISNLVSRYQTSIGIHSLLDSSASSPSGHEYTNPTVTQRSRAVSTESLREPNNRQQAIRLDSEEPQEIIFVDQNSHSEVIDLSASQSSRVTKEKQTSTAKQSAFSKTSISSLINSDESGLSQNVVLKASAQPEKRKRASPKTQSAAKKAKPDTSKKTAKSEAKTEKKDQTPAVGVDANSDSKTDTKKGAKSGSKKAQKVDAKSETKKAAKSKNKTPEIVLPSQDKPSIHPLMTTEKSKSTAPADNIPAPSFIAMENSGVAEPGIGGPMEDKEKAQPPLIALDIPLLDPKNPKPGKAEVVVNVLKLAEEKYGWTAVHPEARSAFELMDDVLDDDDDGEEEEEEEVMIVDDQGVLSKKKEEGTDKKKEEGADKKKEEGTDKKKKKQQSQAKVNRKVGKYDFEDPFIDDAELQWEEEITTTKEGFFVYWGPLVDERQSGKKGAAKSKK